MSNYNYDYEDYDFEDPDLRKHKKCDKIKWIITAVAFVLVFVLIGGLCFAVFHTDGSEKELDRNGKVQMHVLSFEDEENRTSFSESEQVWEDEGIVFTNLKGSGSNLREYVNPVRLYAHSTIEIECENDMTEIIFYCAGTTYVRNLQDSLEDMKGIAVDVNDLEVTVTLDKAADTFEITNLAGQVQLSQIAVKAIAPALSDADDEEEMSVGGITIPEETDDGNGIALTSFTIPVEQYSEYDIMPIADSAQVITATVSPDNSGTNTAVSWVATWKNPSSSWATGKDVSTYIKLAYGSTVSASKSCTVTCLQAFGEQVIITVSADDNPTVRATVTADYQQRVSDFSLKFGTVSCTWSGTTNVTLELNENGSPTGGLPTLTPTTSSTYTKTANYSVTYTLKASDSDQVFVSGSGTMSNGVSVGFFTYSGDGTYSATNPYNFANYNVKTKGLYFGLKFFVDNMGFGGRSYFMTSHSAMTYTSLVSAISNAYDNYTAGTYTSWKTNKTIFRLTVTLTNNGETISKYTDFNVSAYKNTSTITSVGVNNSAITF